MRLQFRNRGHAERYHKLCRAILEKECCGPEDCRLGLQQIRDAIYRGFGFNSFNEFQRVFVPDDKITSWFHSKEQLVQAFRRAFDNAIKVANQRGFEVYASPAALTQLAVDRVMTLNKDELDRFIERERLLGDERVVSRTTI